MSLSSKSSCSTYSDASSNSLDGEKTLILIRKKEQLTALREDEAEMAFNDYTEKRSRASIGISQISVPLAWISKQHFKQKGERTFSMFATLQTKTNVVDTKIISNINSSDTDVTFPESFVFHNEPDNFCVELCVYAARTDFHGEAAGSLRQKISRSFGKTFGLQIKSQMADARRTPEVLGSAHFNMIARCMLSLRDAGEECKIHDLKISTFADLAGPPLYGHVVCRLVCLPQSVSTPLADGILTVRPSNSESVFQRVRCRLQAGVLRCFVNSPQDSRDQVLHKIIITPGSRVIQSTLDSTSFVLVLEPTSDSPTTQYVMTTASKDECRKWKAAIEQQLVDARIWREFAYTYTRLSLERPREVVDGTYSRDRSSRLYDTINITGTWNAALRGSLSKTGLPVGLQMAIAEQSPVAKTAPAKRPKARGSVRGIFEEVTPAPAKPSTSENEQNSRYVINLKIENEPPLTRVHHKPPPSPFRSPILPRVPRMGILTPEPMRRRPKPLQVASANEARWSWNADAEVQITRL